MPIDVNAIAALASLELSPEEAGPLQTDLARILDYVALLNQMPTEGVPPTAHLVDNAPEATLRDDQVRATVSPWEAPAAALANAPAQAGNMFEVPKIIERG
ncbi:MAG: Asp-tRNA(Asn)/Glu-tRNA(Gln) amidotransferase subunit GatC [Terriglobales bacterium]|jgi:aspartyl-tRNA(Asn)/glutamyl-tRNA(Gln) amidotransferase subunit C